MTVWRDILAEAVEASGQSGDLLTPTSLLELSNDLDNPLATLSGRDTENEVFAALDEDLGFVWDIKSTKLAISEDQRVKLAGAIRWLIGALSDWSQADDLRRARLMAMIAVAARLDEDGALWMLMPNSIVQNRELGEELRDILGRLQLRLEAAAVSRSPIMDTEQIKKFEAAEAERNWPELRAFVENVHWRFCSNVVLDQSARLLNRFFPDYFAEAGRAVSQVGVAMQMVTAISVGDALKIATQSDSHILQFSAVCRLFARYEQVGALDAVQEDALVALLSQVAPDRPRWIAWMQTFATHPYRARQMQPAIGRCLAVSDEAALCAYIDAIHLWASWVGREDVKACLSAFADCVSLERRQEAWRLAYARWSEWNFGERVEHTALTEITLSNMDFGIVGYALECLTPEERETHIAGCLDMVERSEHVWHKSHLESMHYIYRALSRSQPFLHARECGTGRENWLWSTSVKFFFDQLDDPYWRFRYNLRQ